MGPRYPHWRCVANFAGYIAHSTAKLYPSPSLILLTRYARTPPILFAGRASVSSGGAYVKRLATAGCDNKVRVYRCGGGGGSSDAWELESTLSRHRDWVRDVAWAPGSGLSVNTLASASDDGTVVIWRQQAGGGDWAAEALPPFPAPVWRVSWSTTGNLLAVSCGDNSVTLWKESLSGHFQQVSSVPDPTLPAPPKPAGY